MGQRTIWEAEAASHLSEMDTKQHHGAAWCWKGFGFWQLWWIGISSRSLATGGWGVQVVRRKVIVQKCSKSELEGVFDVFCNVSHVFLSLRREGKLDDFELVVAFVAGR